MQGASERLRRSNAAEQIDGTPHPLLLVQSRCPHTSPTQTHPTFPTQTHPTYPTQTHPID